MELCAPYLLLLLLPSMYPGTKHSASFTHRYYPSKIRADAPWGLASLSSPTKLPTGSSPTALNYTYSYDSAGLAANVDVYILGKTEIPLSLPILICSSTDTG